MSSRLSSQRARVSRASRWCTVVASLSLVAGCGRTVLQTPRGDGGADGAVESDSNDEAVVITDDAEVPPDDAEVPPDDAEVPPPIDAEGPPHDAVSPGDFQLERRGPITPREFETRFTAPSSTGCASACTVTLRWSVPLAPSPDGSRSGPYPLVVFSNGFQLTASQYQSYATRLATWGYSVLRWDTSETLLRPLGHETLAKMLVALVDHAEQENNRDGAPARGLLSTTRVLLAGHSRGGKVSVLAATRDPRVAGVALLDPVDTAPMFATPASEYPSAVAALRASMRTIPLVALGAGLAGTSRIGMPCAPTSGNYAQFFLAARTPAWEIVVPEAGHMSVLDNPNCGPVCAVCTNGVAPAERVRALATTLLVAWSERTLRDVDVSAYGPGGAWLASTVAGGFATARSR